MTDRELMQQALEALKLIDDAMPFPVAKLAMKNLRERLAQPEQEQNSTCNKTLRAEGKVYPRTCRKCGKGPCITDRVQPEPEQEPVWIQPNHLQKARQAPFLCRVEPKQRDDFVPLYTSPPASKPWVGLTDAAVWSLYKNLWMFHPAEEPRLAGDILKFARAIEAKLREKNA